MGANTRNNRVGLMAAAVAGAMVGLAFASVPLYRAFCQATGYGGIPARVSEAEAAQVKPLAGQSISIRFDANVEAGMPWHFTPEISTQTVAIGARKLAFFDAENPTDHVITGQASYNIEPGEAAHYFTKVQCFCFTRQTLQPHEKVRMPVIYYVDPAFLADPDMKGIEQITLSYTFHEVHSG
ncbi:MAG: cytochrome c oxidase assembly protein [Sphingomonadales bacterium]|nr:cytochrome c oxidase assembly protein [Sphingomonadales bacterium]